MSERRSPGNAVRSRAAARALADDLRRAQHEIARIPVQELSRIIGASCHSLLNGLDDDAVREITANSGLSRVMVREVVRGMGASWSAEAIARMVAAEFPDPGVLDGFVADGSTDPPPRSITATAPALTLLIGSGAVPGVTVTAMIRALVVKSAVLAKPGAGDTALTTRFTRELFRTDPRVGAAAAVRCWPGGAAEWDAWERELFGAADQVVTYGSDRTIESVRARTPAATRLIEHPNRVGVAIVDLRDPGTASQLAQETSAVAQEAGPSNASALANGPPNPAAHAVARAAALFEQRGCVSTQLVLLLADADDPSDADPAASPEPAPDPAAAPQSGPAEPAPNPAAPPRPHPAAQWCATLAQHFAALEAALPPPPAAPGDLAQRHQLHGRLAMRAAAREAEHGRPEPLGDPEHVVGLQLWRRSGSRWTVILASADDFEPVGGRTVWVVPAADTDACLQTLSRLGPVLQTVGLAGLVGAQRTRFARRLAEVGVTRIVPLDQVPFPESDWLHDGSRPLGELVRWTELR